MRDKMRAIIAAAGTGGHINPGLAIANKIMEKEKDSSIIFIGTNRGLETDLVPRSGYSLKTINAHGLERKITIQNIKNLFETYKSIKEAKEIIKEFKPDILIGTGGYICVPTVIAAKKLGIPVILHESNAFPGIAVKLFKNKADKILVGFKDAKERLDNKENVIVTGNPIKIKKIDYTESQKEKIKTDLGLALDKPVVLVFGGSQGAQSINRSFIEIIVNKKNKNYQIMWAAGPEQYEKIKEKLNEINIDINNIENAKIVPYIYNMEEVMNISDLVVCRSGAMTITEVSVVGKPAIFIPFPFATENHQEYNARVLEKVGAAKIILDKDINSELLGNTINKIIKNKKSLEEMGKNAEKVTIPNVEENIYKEIKEVIENKKIK
jgi:UDP-N-acetylglucosamine--N-acetylmuramyl-(pentapeptide) pyrophosphoryl-undecaprenol N-acetylglucosamine transferase